MTPPARKRRPSASLLVSILALFVALGGTGIAQDVVGEISAKISGKRIAKNAIKSKHIKNGKVKAVDLAPGVVPDAYSKTESDGKYQAQGDYLAANGKAADSELLDGKDSTEFLGKTEKAADADTLDGTDSNGFQRGVAYHGAATMNEGAAETTLFVVADRLRVRGVCNPGDPPTPNIDVEHLVNWDGGFFNRLTDSGLGDGMARLTSANVQNGDEQSFGSGASEQEITEHVMRSGILFGSEFVSVHAFSGPVGVTQCAFTATGVHRDTRGGLVFNPGPIIFDP